ncbi:hypothetical protein VB776_13485 [Arcicella sp. DC2W]|uniref:Uncharacterized protein n=1 Tax=Arcicella gelida TaxID=2984195 RepID=A0ABU5S672_9BACT|nr:hypothetical protein [Arcicella sp. DC2W]MEA5403935.1 hypothetical protein [Arcicella sp. DC2W]
MVKTGIEAIDFFVIFTVYHPLEIMKVDSTNKPYLFKKVKTYSAEEIIAAGGSTAFGKLTGHTPERLKDMPVGEPLTEEEYQKALKMLKK